MSNRHPGGFTHIGSGCQGRSRVASVRVACRRSSNSDARADKGGSPRDASILISLISFIHTHDRLTHLRSRGGRPCSQTASSMRSLMYRKTERSQKG
jgi:hypothetical protein